MNKLYVTKYLQCLLIDYEVKTSRSKFSVSQTSGRLEWNLIGCIFGTEFCWSSLFIEIQLCIRFRFISIRQTARYFLTFLKLIDQIQFRNIFNATDSIHYNKRTVIRVSPRFIEYIPKILHLRWSKRPDKTTTTKQRIQCRCNE